MNPEQLFEVWAPADSLWSPWAKPVLFAQGESTSSEAIHWHSIDVSWAPNPSERTAIILDVSGRSAVEMGLALASIGYRPVPLFNTCSGPKAIVDVQPICSALAAAGEAFSNFRIEHDAPPVFLLDAGRMFENPASRAKPGDFDNRWLVFPQDFPSANFLLAHEIRTALVVQQRREKPADDVAHVLRRWQDAGITIHAKNLANEAAPAHIDVPRPPRYKVAWHRAIAALGLRRNAAGGFGAIVPHPSSGTG